MKRTSLAAPRNEGPLTAREREIVDLLCDGMDWKQIAQQLGLTFGTAKGYSARIFNKTGYSTSLELAVRTLQKRHQAEIDTILRGPV